MSDIQRMTIAADDRLLSQVRDFVGMACAKFGMSARAIANIRLAVDEACTNVVKHAYAQRPGELTIEIGVRRPLAVLVDDGIATGGTWASSPWMASSRGSPPKSASDSAEPVFLAWHESVQVVDFLSLCN